jgi:hypothetical protein
VSALTLPFELPARLARRAVDDLGAIAGIARELPARLEALEARADRVQEQLDRALALGETVAANSAAIVELGQRIEARGESMIDLGERMIGLGDSVMAQSAVIADRAQEVADRGADVAAALPMLERAVSIATPLEGTVERLGRALDRLPGGRPRTGDSPRPETPRPNAM